MSAPVKTDLMKGRGRMSRKSSVESLEKRSFPRDWKYETCIELTKDSLSNNAS